MHTEFTRVLITIQLMYIFATPIRSIHDLQQLSTSNLEQNCCLIVEPVPRAAPDNPSPFLQVVVNPNGTVTRPFFPTTPPNQDPTAAVFSTDVTLNSARGTSLRIYVPQSHASSQEGEKVKKLPTVLFIHGGGFVLFSAATVIYHQFCEKLSGDLPAVVVSVDYRLAPEFRLPAAYEDATEALQWLQHQAAADSSRREPVLRHADLSRIFLMGGSAGGNIVYHVGLEAALKAKNHHHHLNYIAGLIMYQPFFGGVCRTASDLTGYNDWVIPLQANDLMWELSLPKGATTRDHPFAHPTETTKLLPKCLVTGSVQDPLIDWQRKFVELLEDAGVELVAHLDGNGTHGAELNDSKAARLLIDHVRVFITCK